MSTLSSHSTDLPPEQQVIRAKCFHPTDNFIEFNREEIEQSIPDRFEEQVRRHPDRLAVKANSEQLTYDELNKAANRVAQAILAPRHPIGSFVQFIVDRSCCRHTPALLMKVKYQGLTLALV